MADSPTSEPAGSRPRHPAPAGPEAAAPAEPAAPATRADLAGLAHQVRTEMAHLRRDLAQRLDAASERFEVVLSRRHARLSLALIATQCLVTVLSVAVLRLTT